MLVYAYASGNNENISKISAFIWIICKLVCELDMIHVRARILCKTKSVNCLNLS